MVYLSEETEEIDQAEEKTDRAEIPLAQAGIAGNKVKVLYPSNESCIYGVTDGKLQVTMPQTACARLFEIRK